MDKKIIEILNNLSIEKKELFFKALLKGLGFNSFSIIQTIEEKKIVAVGNIELGILSYQFIIYLIFSNELITDKELKELKNQSFPHTNKGLIISTSTFTKSAKKEKRKKGEIPVDLIDGSQLVKRVKELNLSI